MIAHAAIRAVANAVLLSLAAYNGLYLGDNPGPDGREGTRAVDHPTTAGTGWD